MDINENTAAIDITLFYIYGHHMDAGVAVFFRCPTFHIMQCCLVFGFYNVLSSHLKLINSNRSITLSSNL